MTLETRAQLDRIGTGFGEWAPFRAAVLCCQGWGTARQKARASFGLFGGGNIGKAALAGSPFWVTRMIELLQFISYVLTLYVYVVIAMAILSWLIAFNVVNTRNPVVHMIADLLYRLTEPVLRPIRNLLPSLGGIDISPVILFLIILFIQSVILPNIAKLFI
jgi:YggT family protein